MFWPLTLLRSKFSCVWTAGSGGPGSVGRVQADPRTSRHTALVAPHISSPESESNRAIFNLPPTVLRRNSPLTLFCPLSARVCLGPHLKCIAVISRQPWTSEFEAKTNNPINRCQNIKREIKVKPLLGFSVNMF